MEKIINELIDDLKAVNKKAQTKLSAYPGITEKLDIDLGRSINFLQARMQGGKADDVLGAGGFSKVTTVGGVNLSEHKTGGKKAFQMADKKKDEKNKGKQNPKEAEADELRKEVNRLDEGFDGIDNDAVLSDFSDLAIRGLAKRHKVPVTETDPEKLDVNFIESIRTAIKEKENLDL